MRFIQILPPFLLDFYLNNLKSTGWFGNYLRWSDALENSSGYDDNKIIRQVVSSTEMVISGKAYYEKDGVLFYEPSYNWPVLTHLLYAANHHKGKLAVLDFGGGLGSIYFQHKKYLSTILTSWSVVEQANFVAVGKQKFETEQLKFYSSIEESCNDIKPNVLILACVLQYLEEPYLTLKKLVSENFEIIILDRIALTSNDTNRITVQKVPKKIYPASYPAWFLSISKIKALFESQYELISEYPCDEKPNISGYFVGLVYKRK